MSVESWHWDTLKVKSDTVATLYGQNPANWALSIPIFQNYVLVTSIDSRLYTFDKKGTPLNSKNHRSGTCDSLWGCLYIIVSFRKNLRDACRSGSDAGGLQRFQLQSSTNVKWFNLQWESDSIHPMIHILVASTWFIFGGWDVVEQHPPKSSKIQRRSTKWPIGFWLGGGSNLFFLTQNHSVVQTKQLT